MSTQTLRHRLTAATLLALLVFAPAQQAALAQTPQELQTINAFLDLMNKYYTLMGSMHEAASDPERAAILQMHKIQEVFEDSGNKADVEPVLRKVLEDSDNPTIRASASLMLGELYKETGRSRDAVEVLRQGLQDSLRLAR